MSRWESLCSYGGIPPTPYIIIRTFLITTLVIPAVFVLHIGCAHAGSTSVVNSISVSSHTGGQNASGGTVTEGRSTSSVDITTRVDGAVVEDIHIRSTSTPIEIHHTIRSTNPSMTTPTLHEATQTSAVEVTATDTTKIISPSSALTINQSVPEDTRIEESTAPSLFVRIMSSLNRVVTYVLSNLFS